MIIVLDTNIWIEEVALKSNIGSSFRLYANFNKIKIGVPEVIRMEFEHNIESRINELIDSTNANYSKLLAHFGELKSIILPEKDKVKELARGLIDNCGIPIENINFSLESARSSLLKTILGLPPSSDKNQQFKDGVIWHDCVELLEREDVILITLDKAFYRNRNYSEGLADNLLQEIREKAHKFKIYSRLSEILQIVKTSIPLDIKSLVIFILDKNKTSISNMIDEDEVQISNNYHASQKAYATENSSIIYVEYFIEVDCEDEKNTVTASLSIKGDALLDINRNVWNNVSNEFIEYANPKKDKKLRSVFLKVNGVSIGHKTEYFKSREELKP